MNKESDFTFQYMLLDRMQMDCNYYLGNGNRNSKHLWAGNPKDQIKEMKKIWKILPIKPEWISMEDINEFDKQMNNS